MITAQTKKKGYESWMGDNFENLKNVKLSDICLPGSHDSGAYKVDFSKNLRPSGPDHKKPDRLLNFIGRLPFMGLFIKAWAVTQKKSIKQQLEAGIRALDLRVSYNNRDKKFYISHRFACVSLDDALSQIRTFMDSHPQEIIIIKMAVDHDNKMEMFPMVQAARNQVKTKFAGLLCKRNARFDNPDLQIEKMVNNSERIVFMSDDRYLDPLWKEEYVWPSTTSCEKWLNQTTSDGWERAFESRSSTLWREGACNSIGADLTPRYESSFIKTIIFNFAFLYPLKYLATQMRPVIAKIFTDPAKIPASHKLNILFSDHVDENSISPIIKYTVDKATEMTHNINATNKASTYDNLSNQLGIKAQNEPAKKLDIVKYSIFGKHVPTPLPETHEKSSNLPSLDG